MSARATGSIRSYKRRDNGTPYVITAQDCETPAGTTGTRITCSCSIHPAGMSAAVHAEPTLAAKVICGYVRMAHHPVVGPAMAQRGRLWKA